MKCPHCKTELTDHDTFAPKTGGAMHCFKCGCCFQMDGKTPRPGVPLCEVAAAAVAEMTHSLSTMKKDDLLKATTAAGIAVDEDATVPELREALAPPPPEEEPPAPPTLEAPVPPPPPPPPASQDPSINAPTRASRRR